MAALSCQNLERTYMSFKMNEQLWYICVAEYYSAKKGMNY